MIRQLLLVLILLSNITFFSSSQPPIPEQRGESEDPGIYVEMTEVYIVAENESSIIVLNGTICVELLSNIGSAEVRLEVDTEDWNSDIVPSSFTFQGKGVHEKDFQITIHVPALSVGGTMN